MKFGIIGLGDIAQKAYLPVLSEKEEIELVLCTRNADTLQRLAKKYRIQEIVQSTDELIAQGVQAAFVNAATDGYVKIAEKLLKNGIHTYIDKPISMNFAETKRIVKLAKESGKIAMVGFNRRFAPMVKKLRENGKAKLIIMQKNRFSSPDYTNEFVYDDFIHVIDTLRFLMDTPVKDVKIEYLKNGELLDHLILTMFGDDCTVLGIMNKNSGVSEEIIEYSTVYDKYVVKNLVETTHFHNKDICISNFGDWEPTLSKRGFSQIIEHFIDCVQQHQCPVPTMDDSLITHEICDRIVNYIDSSD